MRSLTLALLLLAAPASAETLSEEIARTGLAPTEARLAALPAPTNEDLFALAGLRFLGGIEAALQLRWQTGVQSNWSELPILRLPIPANPTARPFEPADFTTLIKGLDTDMEAARAALAQLGDKPFALDIRLADLWFDIDGNGTRSAGEDLARSPVWCWAAGGRWALRSAIRSSPSTPPMPPGFQPIRISSPDSPRPLWPMTPNPRSAG